MGRASAREPADFKRREWLYAKHYICKYVSVTIDEDPSPASPC